MKKFLKLTMIFVLSIFLFNACGTEDLEPTLAQSKSVEGSITKVDNLYSILKGIHSQLTSTGYYGGAYILTNEARSDNCFSNGFSGRYSTQAEYEYNSNTGWIWDNCYSVIANSNIIINTDLASLEGDQDYGQHLKGQATAIRAMAHFDLVKGYGQQHTPQGNLGVPIVTVFKGDDLYPSRNTVDEVKAAIYADLESAYNMMSTTYDSKIFLSKYAAKALESRVAVYFGDWSRAKSAAEAVISSGLYSIAPAASYVSNWDIDQAANSIFELEYNSADNAGINGLAYLYRFEAFVNGNPTGYGDVEAVSDLIDIFEDGDVRKDILGYQEDGVRLRNMRKYPSTTTADDNVPLIRFEEVVLNYAEALFETNAAGQALIQLNSITSNRGASAYTAVTKENILMERRKELMFEGFRFDDMMRTGMNAEALGSIQNVIEVISYPDNRFAWPIPKAEMDANSNMVQNNGY